MTKLTSEQIARYDAGEDLIVEGNEVKCCQICYAVGIFNVELFEVPYHSDTILCAECIRKGR